jgi:hypothetical protein
VKVTNDKNQPCFCGKATVQISSKWHSNCPCLVIVLFCYWKYGKATVQLSPIWLSNCSCLVIVLYCYWKYGKATVQLSPKWHSNCPCLIIVLFCYWKYGKATVQLSSIWLSNCSCLVIFYFCIGIESIKFDNLLIQNILYSFTMSYIWRNGHVHLVINYFSKGPMIM